MAATFQLNIKFDDDIAVIQAASPKNLELLNVCLSTQILRTLQKTTQSDEVVIDASSKPTT